MDEKINPDVKNPVCVLIQAKRQQTGRQLTVAQDISLNNLHLIYSNAKCK